MILTTAGATEIARLDDVPSGLTITARLVDGDETLPTTVTVAPVLDVGGDPLNARTATFVVPALLPVELQWLDGATVVGSEIVALASADLATLPMTATLENAPAGLTITARLVDGDETLPIDVAVAPLLDANGDPLNAYVATFPTPLAPPVTIEWLQGATVVGSEVITDGSGTFSGRALVSLAAVKNYLNINASDEAHDERLTRAIHGVTAVIEGITGPILPQTFTERHAGGGHLIAVHHPPSRGLGTTPIFTLVSCDAAGSSLAVVDDPSVATGECVLFDGLGIISRYAGSAAARFARGPRAVRVVYVAGQSSVPANVHEAALELIRVNWTTTQAVGRGRMTVSDDQDSSGPALGFFIPRRVRELLAPNDDPTPLVA